jgi:signal peptidase II
MNSKPIYFFAAIIVLVADQVTKLWATTVLIPGWRTEIIPGFFRLIYALNSGVAFSICAECDRWALVALSAVAAVVVIVCLVCTSPVRVRRNTAFALLLAGITGNLIDRVRLAGIVDFLNFHWGEHFTLPTFNLADAALCIGVALLILELMQEWKDDSLQPQAPAPLIERDR